MRWWEIIASFGPFVGALATVALAWLAWRQLRSLTQQVEQGRRELEAAQTSAGAARESAEAAWDAVRESTRSRLDQTAPRVVVLFEAPEWPPFIDRNRAQIVASELMPLDVLGQSYVASDHDGDFVFPEEARKLLWFRVRGVVINEGNSTAHVHIPGEARFIEGKTNLLGEQHLELPYGPDQHGQRVLRPGQAGLFEWGVGNSLGDWADAADNPEPPNPRGSYFRNLAVFSPDWTILDKIYIELRATPVERVHGRENHWKLTRRPQARVVIWETRRRYRGEDPPQGHPWDDRYAEWRQQR